jgi:hypothetical protein
LYPHIVDHQRFLACFNDVRRCYSSAAVAPAVHREVCWFHFQQAHISRCPFSCLKTFVDSIVDQLSKKDSN